MKLTEKHTIRRGDVRYDILDQECYKSKNLYNASLYTVRQYFFENKSYLSYYTLQPQFQKEKQPDYCALPTKVAQQTMKMVDQNFRTFFRSLKSFKANPGKFKARPRIPKYLDKMEGRYMLVYTSQAISKKVLDREGKIKLSGIDVSVPTRVTFPQLCEVRVVRRPNAYVIEVVYDDEKEVTMREDNGRYAAIDLGVGNFATVTSNVKGFRRGLFRSRDGRLINADVNGSYNILRKCMPKAFGADGVEGVLVHPVVIKTTNVFH